MLQAVCVEAGMLALRRDAIEVNHEDFNEGIVAVQVCIMILVNLMWFFFQRYRAVVPNTRQVSWLGETCCEIDDTRRESFWDEDRRKVWFSGYSPAANIS